MLKRRQQIGPCYAMFPSVEILSDQCDCKLALSITAAVQAQWHTTAGLLSALCDHRRAGAVIGEARSAVQH